MTIPFAFWLSFCTNGDRKSEGADRTVEANHSGIRKEGPEKVDPREKYDTLVRIETRFGNMLARLYKNTPRHRKNFIKLVQEGFYDSLLFHRVIPGFMVQGGDPESRDAGPKKQLGMGDPGYTLPAEIRKENFHKRGALAAARKGDRQNPERRSNGSQFFLVQGKTYSAPKLEKMEEQRNQKRKQRFKKMVLQGKQELRKRYIEARRSNDKAATGRIEKRLDSLVTQKYGDKATFSFSEKQVEAYTSKGGAPHLDGQYTCFGEVVKGLGVIDSIAGLKTDQNDRPVEDVRMEMKLVTD